MKDSKKIIALQNALDMRDAQIAELKDANEILKQENDELRNLRIYDNPSVAKEREQLISLQDEYKETIAELKKAKQMYKRLFEAVVTERDYLVNTMSIMLTQIDEVSDKVE